MEINRTDLESKFKSRLKTQDRDGRLPMRVIQKLFHNNDSWDDILTRCILHIRFLTSANGKEWQHLSNVEKVTINEHSKSVTITCSDGSIYDVYTEKYNRLSKGGIFELLQASSLKELSLDHPIPMFCLLETHRYEHLKQLNEDFGMFLCNCDDDELDSTSKKASAFCCEKQYDQGFLDGLLEELRHLFLDTNPLTIMQLKDNITKNSHIVYCDKYLECEHSKFKNNKW